MPELQTVPDLLAKAESAASAGDLASADELLRAIARIQEHELGAHHPDLANTLNNLAIVAENTGRLDDAESFYRRAVAIASASLAPDDPMLAAGRKNLEDFCRVQGIPVEKPAVIAPPADQITTAPAISAPANVPSESKVPDTAAVVDAGRMAHSPVPPAAAASSSRPQPPPVAPSPPKPSQPSPPFGKVAIAIVVLVIAALFVMRPWSSNETPVTNPASNTATPAPGEPPQSSNPEPAQRPSAPPAAEAATPTAPAPQVDSSRAPGKTGAPDASSGPVALVTAELCRSLSTSGSWHCEPAGDSVAPGQLVFYTRVKSPRPTKIVHRWYRGTTLRRSVDLEIRASANEGYRTFSRQTVDAGEEWRVEVRSASGDLLHEQRVSVR
jgi:hypothetical protein